MQNDILSRFEHMPTGHYAKTLKGKGAACCHTQTLKRDVGEKP